MEKRKQNFYMTKKYSTFLNKSVHHNTSVFKNMLTLQLTVCLEGNW